MEQSPIDLKCCDYYSNFSGHLKYDKFKQNDAAKEGYLLFNTGYTGTKQKIKCQNKFIFDPFWHFAAQVSLAGDIPIDIEKGPLDAAYEFLNLHFHWGTNNSVGSEHANDGK